MKGRLFRSSPKVADILALHPSALEQEFDAKEIRDNEEADAIAVVSVCGPLEHHKSWFWDSYDAILERLELAFQSEARCVVLCIDSPGGDAAGATEVHKKIQRLKKQYQKKLYAYSNENMFSAAYSIGCAADEIWLPETGGVGSVGVICTLLDKTKANEKAGLNIKLLSTGKRKADGQEDRELTDDVIATMQERVDYLGDVFFRVVGKARGMTPKKVAALEAGVFLGQKAVESGLADGVAGWYKFLQYVDVQASTQIDTNASSEEKSPMKTKAQLKKARDKAAEKLQSAKSESDKKKAFTAYEMAAQEFAEFEAKTKYVKKTEERLTEEPDEEEEEESEESEDEEDCDDDEDMSEDEEEDDESDSKEKSEANVGSFSKKGIDLILNTAAELTGVTDPSEIAGALSGMNKRLKKQDKLEKRLGNIEQRSKKDRVTAMLDAAQKDGRITPVQAKGLIQPGMNDIGWLKGYLSAMPKQVRNVDEAMSPNFDSSSPELDSKNMTADQKKMLQQFANSCGMSVEDYQKKMNETKNRAAPSPNKTNGAPNGIV